MTVNFLNGSLNVQTDWVPFRERGDVAFLEFDALPRRHEVDSHRAL